MKFSSKLTEAVLLRRLSVIRFLAEIVLPNRQKLVIRCPNTGDMRGCDILGTKVWYSKATGYHCLPTLEIIEADGGNLVCVNPELMKPLVIDALKQNLITEISGYNVLHAGGHYDQFRSQFLLLEKDQQQCYMGIEQVIVSADHGVGVFPSNLGEGSENLRALIKAREDGHRAILLYCVMHAGISYIKTAANIDPDYANMLQQAASEGVEILAYRTHISLDSIELTTNIPVLYAEKTVKSKLS
jgi:sugar fermentation stimulation protein A